MHNNGTKITPASRCSVAGDIDADLTSIQITQNRLTGDTLVTDEGILIFEM